MSVKIKPYERSGGVSEKRYYDGAEKVIIEAHKANTAVAWSSRVPAAEFAQRIGALLRHPEGTSVIFSGEDDPVPWQDAQAVIRRRPELSFLAIDAPDESFTWSDTATDDKKREAYPGKLGQVSMLATTLNEEWLRTLLEATATPAIQGDIAGILASTHRIAGQRGQ